MPVRNRSALVVVLVALGFASGVTAQGAPITVKEEKKGLLKLAKVLPADAIKTAQAQFPNATMKSAEIEKEKGKLIYSFDMQQPGVKGIEEVNIDANTGAVVNTEHENPAPPKKHSAPKPPVKKPPAA
jgi:uncharacterized membrane protein YkoI